MGKKGFVSYLRNLFKLPRFPNDFNYAVCNDCFKNKRRYAITKSGYIRLYQYVMEMYRLFLVPSHSSEEDDNSS